MIWPASGFISAPTLPPNPQDPARCNPSTAPPRPALGPLFHGGVCTPFQQQVFVGHVVTDDAELSGQLGQQPDAFALTEGTNRVIDSARLLAVNAKILWGWEMSKHLPGEEVRNRTLRTLCPVLTTS